MLVEFTVSNSHSVWEQQALSLTMAKGGELIASNTFDPGALGGISLLRSAVIYGPNAAGKSNLLKSLSNMRKMVISSATDIQPGDSLPISQFLLNSQASNRPTEFEATFITKGVRYQYGFACTPDRVVEEWLFAYPHGRPQRWIGRVWNEDEKRYEWDKMSSLSGQKQLWQESTRYNGLFISTAVQLNSQQLQPIYDWFKNTLKMTNVMGWSSGFTASLCKSTDKRKQVLDFLQAADLDIHDIHVEVEKMSVKHLPDEMPDEMKEKILEQMKDHDMFDVKTVHLNELGKSVEFDIDIESDGTQKLFALTGPWLDTLEKGHVLVIDELHDNLHPKIVKFLVQLFHNAETNPNNAQLIFTTHDTSILNQDVFRRDQIWFCEKDKQQATHLYPLTEFSPRKGRENLEAAYLVGRYGALPYVRSIKKAGAA